MNIKLEHANYIYSPETVEEITAVCDACVEFKEDSFNAIIGSTGSGKSTLIQLLNGLLKPSSGKVLYDGKEIYTDSKETKEQQKALRNLRCKVGLVFQHPEYQLFEETIIKDVMYGPKNKGLTNDEAKEAAIKALGDVGIDESMFEKSPFDLSGGEKKRVAIAGILSMQPEVLILDEPTAGLDPIGKKEILDLVKEYQINNHVTVIVVSHSMEEVAMYAERVIAMKRGKIMFDDKVHEIFKHEGELEKMGLAIPEAAKFAKELGIEDVITVEEAAKKIAQKYKHV